tara:strand:+ start:97 stop:312 length:216 start_codon:yes stop_codon:yes gene_type:complete
MGETLMINTEYDREKERLRAKLAQDKAAYFAAGGKVTNYPAQTFASSLHSDYSSRNKKVNLRFGDVKKKYE